MTEFQPLPAAVLPPGVRSRRVPGVNGLAVHVLEAGHETPGRPCVLLLHGFPELAYSWRRVMPALAAAGFHVLAPDQRGYGRTTGWSDDYDADLAPFRTLNLVRDALALVLAFGHSEVAAVVGHDAGARVAGCAALARPDVFRRAVMMSAPFSGPPTLPFGTADAPPPARPAEDVHAALAALPQPRKHYQWYYATPAADGDMRRCPEGLHDFLRAYYHGKSGDWAGNRPYPLRAWTAESLAELPRYYVMDLDRTMPESVRPMMPSPGEIAACDWLPDDELAVYAGEFGRTGFQGGLQWYRCNIDPAQVADLALFSGRKIEVPACFIAGARDWGVQQVPGAAEAMQHRACADMRDFHLVEGAGHWVQQERPTEVNRLLLDFLGRS